MSTPPTGEDPPRGPFPDESPYGAPASGQPGYGQFGGQTPPPWLPAAPQAPPPDRTRRRLIFALEAVALAIAVGVATLVYVLSATILRPEAVERDVAALFEESEGVAIDLDCRQRMIVRPGADYECDGVTADGEEVEIRITIENDDGAYTWAED